MTSNPITPPARGRAWKFLRRTAVGGILLIVLYLALLAGGIFDCAPPDLSRFQRPPVPANAFDVLELPKDPRYQNAVLRTKDKSFDVFRDDNASDAPPSLQEAWNKHIQETKDFLADICACPGPWTIDRAKDAPGYAGFEEYPNLYRMAADLGCQIKLRRNDAQSVEEAYELTTLQISLALRVRDASQSIIKTSLAARIVDNAQAGLTWHLHHNPDPENLAKLAGQLKILEESDAITMARSIRGEIITACRMIHDYHSSQLQLGRPDIHWRYRLTGFLENMFLQPNRTVHGFSTRLDVLAENFTLQPDKRLPVPSTRDLPVWFPHPNMSGNKMQMIAAIGSEYWIAGWEKQQASHALMRTAVAVKRFKLDHQGKWPDTLTALVPDYLDAITSSPAGVAMTLDPVSHVLSYGPVVLKATNPDSGYAPGAGQLRDVDAPAIDLGKLLAE